MESYFTVMFAFLTMFVYQLFPARKRWIVLLVASLIFFWSISGSLILFVILSGFMIHYFGLWMENIDLQCSSHKEAQKKKRGVLVERKKETSGAYSIFLDVYSSSVISICIIYASAIAWNSTIFVNELGWNQCYIRICRN